MGATLRFSDYPLGLRLLAVAVLVAVLAGIWSIADAVFDQMPLWLVAVADSVIVGSAITYLVISRRRQLRGTKGDGVLASSARHPKHVGLLEKHQRGRRIR